jgi:hypothetical protein
MVAPAHLYRRWFIKNGTFPPGHPSADEPADGYYSSEAQAKKRNGSWSSVTGFRRTN